jgi:hypothetical protein
MQSLTVREIAERIRRPHEDIVTVVDRLRGWTDIGLLKARGERNPGTGKRRLYPEIAVIDALLLTGLLYAHFPVLQSEQIRGEVGAAFLTLGRQAVKQAQTDPPGIAHYLVVSGRPPVRSQQKPSYAVHRYETKSEQPVTRDKVEIIAGVESSIVLNVSALLKTLQPPSA